MAKKQSKLTKEQEEETQRIIDRMTPEQLEQMAWFEAFYEKLPPDMQEAMFQFAQNLSKMSDGEKDELRDMMDKMAAKPDSGDFGDYNGFDDFGEDGDLKPYPHFLSREDVKKCTLRVTLQNMKPAIYRKFNVPSNISLRHLSELLIKLMGWSGYHMNQFRKGNSYYAPAYQREGELPSLYSELRNFNQEDFALSDILSEKGKTIEWEYDFGDSWCHDVRLSSIGDYKNPELRVSFIKGERACPPEDCGGVWGYEDILAIYEKKKARKRLTSEEKDRLDWYGMDPKDFNPEEFDGEEAEEICYGYNDIP